MANSSYSNAWKNCATCAFWEGPRQANADESEVIVNGSVVGICQGFWKGSRKYPNDKCPEWKKWDGLAVWDQAVRATYP